MTDERLTKAMKPAAALKRRLRLALGLGTIGLGAGLGIAVAQGVWMMTGASTAQAAPAVVRAPLPIENCINVAGALEAPNEGDWGYRIRRRDLATIRAAGFDTIRVPLIRLTLNSLPASMKLSLGLWKMTSPSSSICAIILSCLKIQILMSLA